MSDSAFLFLLSVCLCHLESVIKSQRILCCKKFAENQQSNWKIILSHHLGCLPFTPKNQKFQVEIKWYVPFHLERSGKSGRSFEAIHFSHSFRLSRLVSVPFQLPALFKIFHARQNKMAENEGNEGEFENFQITSLKSILLRIILIPL